MPRYSPVPPPRGRFLSPSPGGDCESQVVCHVRDPSGVEHEEVGPLERLGDNAGDAVEAANKDVEGRVRVAFAVLGERARRRPSLKTPGLLPVAQERRGFRAVGMS